MPEGFALRDPRARYVPSQPSARLAALRHGAYIRYGRGHFDLGLGPDGRPCTGTSLTYFLNEARPGGKPANVCWRAYRPGDGGAATSWTRAPP